MNRQENILAGNELLELLQKAQQVKPISVVNGEPIYTFEDSQLLNQAELVTRRANMLPEELGTRALNPGGDTYPSSRKKNAAVNPDSYYDNRYRKSEKEEQGKKITVIEVVTDKRAIETQPTGRCSSENITVYEFHVVKTANGKKQPPVLALTKQIGSAEFVHEFKTKLDVKSMVTLTALINTSAYQSALKPDTLSL